MTQAFLDIAATPSVLAVQTAMGTRRSGGPGGSGAPDSFTGRELGFIAARDSFFMATVSETGWPYVQHRGGPRGFLKVLDKRTLAFADYRGNRQYLSVGNLAVEQRASLILVDHAARRRLKLFARIEAVALTADPALAARVLDADYRAVPERILLVHLEALDWNCPQHITPRFTEAEIGAAVQPLRERLEALENDNEGLRDRLAALTGA